MVQFNLCSLIGHRGQIVLLFDNTDPLKHFNLDNCFTGLPIYWAFALSYSDLKEGDQLRSV